MRRDLKEALHQWLGLGTNSSTDALVLMDSGANEVLRSLNAGSKGQNKSSARVGVTLPSGDSAQAYRNRHGEVCLPRENPASNDQEESNWIAGIRRMIDLSGKFMWDETGAYIYNFLSTSFSGGED